MKYVFLAVFIIVTILHLYASIKNHKAFRDATKGMILLSLMGFYTLGANDVSWLALFALVFSWIGDILLMPKGTKWFIVGGISFMAAHALFIAEYARLTDFSNISPSIIVPIGLAFVVAVAYIFSKLRLHLPKPLFIPMLFYLLLNGGMNCFAIYKLCAGFSIGSLITAVGALLFFISDTSLFFVRFNKDSVQKSHFLVMLTYSIGEFLIVLGLMLL